MLAGTDSDLLQGWIQPVNSVTHILSAGAASAVFTQRTADKELDSLDQQKQELGLS